MADMPEGGHLLVIFHDGTSCWGEVVGLDLRSDLALVQSPHSSQKQHLNHSNRVCCLVITLNELKDGLLQVGKGVATIGNPFGLRKSLEAGVLSAHSWTGDLLQ